ncbi:hypothetical protein AYI68_g5922 [Smittium mucronatum]|uniref:Uncharacterized protein n=1 Tax=Smittium mucronatum TaxID=133383 RepID=A0A1R0GSY5_9FUNG|nr:hypothetical protein AYI68_g5922 [Smittium mucronatum]
MVRNFEIFVGGAPVFSSTGSGLKYMVDHATDFVFVISRARGICYIGFLMAQNKPRYKTICPWEVHIEIS